ncbi:hypothetical protein GCM10027169_09350 [Gordonia jinhuaensis]|uniref:DUF1211 domain-containing protein n=1 Tax=Gordonia jinhuaensis TaxID=1517702 RepID=A0A916TFI1_9ACTN|nr:TMEM175 family protein [Gordonia jinhuaensis]GGB42991.1 hypothetical protein GCM10011489_33110 [Gordonia jinhuaensis]
MADPEEPRSTEGFRRLLAFTDAVVAIALTLLVLPLTDVATETTRSSHGITVWKFLGDNQNALINFAISFIAIAVMWRDHHRVTERYALYDQTIVQLSMVWMATVVLMPFATILNDNQALKWGNSFYVLIADLGGCPRSDTSPRHQTS